jgi:hypothetical protein
VTDPRILSDRRQALEDAFFAREEAKHLAELRAKLAAQKSRDELKAVSGIEDDKVLDKLLELDLSAQDVALISMIPLIQVAWSDGSLEPAERDAVLKAASDQGVKAGSHSHQLLEHWLEKRPTDRLYQTWHDYVEAVAGQLGDVELEILRESLVGLAHDVASAAGGILGLGKISDAEQKILSDIEQTLSR